MEKATYYCVQYLVIPCMTTYLIVKFMDGTSELRARNTFAHTKKKPLPRKCRFPLSRYIVIMLMLPHLLYSMFQIGGF